MTTFWGNVTALLSITVQGNGLLGDYNNPNLYDTISANPYLALDNPEKNPTYPPFAKITARENIKDNWECDISESMTRNMSQNLVNKMITKEVMSDCLEGNVTGGNDSPFFLAVNSCNIYGATQKADWIHKTLCEGVINRGTQLKPLYIEVLSKD